MTMETLIEAIRVAVLSDASDEAKHQGALACRTILTALEAKPGESLAPTDAPEVATGTAATPMPQQIATIVGALRNMPPEQLLDLAIARLRAALPGDAAAPAVPPVRFQIVPIAQLASAVPARRAP
jgi:hypothetical protein